ncbi:MAG: hypothetical protein PHQ60_06950 [Sideroxydans sp.]|nr:hypothetical protein [Sideroxydans sp.]
MKKSFWFGIAAVLVTCSNFAHAFEIYPLSDTQRCSSISEAGLVPVLDKVIYANPGAKDPALDNEKVTALLMGGFGIWKSKFEAANDIILKQEPSVLCIGLVYDAINKPNASAFQKTHIVFGVNFLTTLLHRPGIDSNAALKVTMAHEFSHFLQNRHGLVFEYKLPMLSVKMKELHADCMAGYLLSIGQNLNDQEFQKAQHYLSFIADAHIVGDHGIASQRREAFLYGRNAAVIALNTGHSELNTTSGDIIFACKNKYSWTR